MKETCLAIDVFGREPGFHPKADPIVRTEAGKLRKKLPKYYEDAPTASVRIGLPVGSHVATFDLRDLTLAVGGLQSTNADNYIARGLRVTCPQSPGEPITSVFCWKGRSPSGTT